MKKESDLSKQIYAKAEKLVEPVRTSFEAIPIKADTCSITTIRNEKSFLEIIMLLKRAYQEMGGEKTPTSEKAQEIIRRDLARTSGRSQGRIDELLVYAEWLSYECLNKLFLFDADEDFMKAAQRVKRLLIKDMLSRGFSHHQMEKEISSDMLKLWREYMEVGKIDRKRWTKELAEGAAGAKSTWQSGKKTFGKSNMLKYNPPKNAKDPKKPFISKEFCLLLEGLENGINVLTKKAVIESPELIPALTKFMGSMKYLHRQISREGHSKSEEVDNGTIC